MKILLDENLPDGLIEPLSMLGHIFVIDIHFDAASFGINARVGEKFTECLADPGFIASISPGMMT